MENIIALIRQYAHVGTADMTLGAVTYWSNDQLEIIADTHSYRKVVMLAPLQLVDRTIYRLDIPRHYYAEENVYVDDVLTTVNLEVFDEDRSAVVTEFTYNLHKQEIIFASGLDEDVKYYIQGSFTNLYEALANLWGQKAAQRYDFIDFKGGDTKMAHDQEYEHCKRQETHYRNLTVRRFERG